MQSLKAPGVPLDSILYYRPSMTGNILFGCLYELTAALLFVQLFSRRDWWGLCLPIGAFFQGLGFFLRVPLADNSSSLGLYIIMDFFIVLSPACYFAFNYLWIGRLFRRMEEGQAIVSQRRKHITFLSPRKFGLTFILSDVTTFFIQAAGGGMQVQDSLANTGSKIFLFGIIAQFASYIFFLCLCIPVAVQRQNDDRLVKRMRQLFVILAFSSLWIIVRSVYRTIELAQGYSGTLARSEAWFFGLDSAPLLLAICLYTIAWPSSFVELKVINRPVAFAVPWSVIKSDEQYALVVKAEPNDAAAAV